MGPGSYALPPFVGARGSEAGGTRQGCHVQHRKPAVGFIFITLLLDVLGFGLLIPVGPRLVEQIQGNLNAPGAEAAAAGIVGALAATYAAMQFLCAPALGVLSDRFGRRPILLIALFGSGLDYFAMGFANSLWVLFVTRAINGLSGASFGVCNAYVADVTPPEKRAAGFGMMGAAFGLGFVFGPLLGGILGDTERWLPFIGHGDIRLPFFVAGALTLANWLYGFFVLPESLPRERRGHFTWKRSNPVGALVALGRYPLVLELAASFFLINIAQTALYATWALYGQERYHWSTESIGLSLFVVGIGAALVQGGLARRIIPRLGESRSLLCGLGLGVFTFAAYGLATRGWMIYVIIAFGSLGGVAQPAAQAMISRTVRPYEQGSTQGAMSSLQWLASIFGPLIGSSVFHYFVSARAPVYLPGAPFFVESFLCALGFVVAAWAVTRHWKREEAARGRLVIQGAEGASRAEEPAARA